MKKFKSNKNKMMPNFYTRMCQHRHRTRDVKWMYDMRIHGVKIVLAKIFMNVTNYRTRIQRHFGVNLKEKNYANTMKKISKTSHKWQRPLHDGGVALQMFLDPITTSRCVIIYNRKSKIFMYIMIIIIRPRSYDDCWVYLYVQAASPAHATHPATAARNRLRSKGDGW